MNARALLSALREMLDDEKKPYLWANETLLRKLNNAVREACLRARLLKDDEHSQPALCRIPVSTGNAYLRHRHEILVVRNGRLASKGCKLWALTAESMDRWRPEWESQDETASTPEVMVMDLAQKTLRLWPTPSADDTLYLRVWRVPLPEEKLRLDDDRSGPVINIPDAEELCHWAAYEALMMPDAELENKGAASDHLALFEQRFGARPSLHEMARWADSPPRIRTAVFF